MYSLCYIRYIKGFMHLLAIRSAHQMSAVTISRCSGSCLCCSDSLSSSSRELNLLRFSHTTQPPDGAGSWGWEVESLDFQLRFEPGGLLPSWASVSTCGTTEDGQAWVLAMGPAL